MPLPGGQGLRASVIVVSRHRPAALARRRINGGLDRAGVDPLSVPDRAEIARVEDPP